MSAQAYASSPIPPPLLYVIPLAIGMVLRFVFPVQVLPTTTTLIVGAIIVILSFAPGLPAFRLMRRAKTSVNPYYPTTALVIQGPFRWTRNPIYLSLAMFYAGLALMVNAWWALLLLPMVIVLVQFLVILPEERYLEQKFGAMYVTYKASVRRWF